MGGAGGRKRSAEVAGGVADHEGGAGGCKVAGGDDEVAFIFAGRGVEDDEKGAVGYEGVV